jgi:putative ABC transport system permease protein
MRAGAEFAWLQLFKKKGHFAAAVSGVAFAVALMFAQIGLRDSLLNSSINLYSHLHGDIFMTSWRYQSQALTSHFPRARIGEALGVPGVISAEPVQIGAVSLENPVDHLGKQIVLVGFNPRVNLWDFPGQSLHFDALEQQDSVLFDAHSRRIFGSLAARFATDGEFPVTVMDHHASLAGLLEMGPGFGNDGTLWTSDVSFEDFVGSSEAALPAIGVIDAAVGSDPERVVESLRAGLPSDVIFVTRQQLLEREKSYWLQKSPIGVIFTAGLLLGVIVGAVVVYQILYSDVTNHLPEYATMKAMGYADGALFRVVMVQAGYISAMGFLPGALMGQAMYTLLARATLLPFAMTTGRFFGVYGLTLAMCLMSGALAMLALRRADPAEIF